MKDDYIFERHKSKILNKKEKSKNNSNHTNGSHNSNDSQQFSSIYSQINISNTS